jgi:hypothetical protein
LRVRMWAFTWQRAGVGQRHTPATNLTGSDGCACSTSEITTVEICRRKQRGQTAGKSLSTESLLRKSSCRRTATAAPLSMVPHARAQPPYAPGQARGVRAGTFRSQIGFFSAQPHAATESARQSCPGYAPRTGAIVHARGRRRMSLHGRAPRKFRAPRQHTGAGMRRERAAAAAATSSHLVGI